MVKKIERRNKLRLTRLLSGAKANEMTLSTYTMLLGRLADLKRATRKEIRFGTHMRWDLKESMGDGVDYTVPICSNRDGEIMSYRWIFDEDEVNKNG